MKVLFVRPAFIGTFIYSFIGFDFDRISSSRTQDGLIMQDTSPAWLLTGVVSVHLSSCVDKRILIHGVQVRLYFVRVRLYCIIVRLYCIIVRLYCIIVRLYCIIVGLICLQSREYRQYRVVQYINLYRCLDKYTERNSPYITWSRPYLCLKV